MNVNRIVLTDGTQVSVGDGGVEAAHLGDAGAGVVYDDGRTRLYPLHMVAFVESMDVNRAAVKGAVDKLVEDRQN